MPRVKATPMRQTFGFYKGYHVELWHTAYPEGGGWMQTPALCRMTSRPIPAHYATLLACICHPGFTSRDLFPLVVEDSGGYGRDIHQNSLRFVLDRFKRSIILRRRLRKLAHKARLTRVLAELPAAAWAPVRVERWLEAGVELEDL